MAIGIGRILPALQTSVEPGPYIVLGIAFALYGIALFARGTSRGREEAATWGASQPSRDALERSLTWAGPALGAAVIVLILLG